MNNLHSPEYPWHRSMLFNTTNIDLVLLETFISAQSGTELPRITVLPISLVRLYLKTQALNYNGLFKLRSHATTSEEVYNSSNRLHKMKPPKKQLFYVQRSVFVVHGSRETRSSFSMNDQFDHQFCGYHVKK